MERLLKKKGQVQLIAPAVITLALAAIVLTFALMMLDDLLINTGDTVVRIDNETLTTVTEVGEQVARATVCAFSGFGVTYMTNATGGPQDPTIPSTNYTFDSRNGIVKYAGGAGTGFNNTNWNATYSYKFGNNSACTGANQTLEGLGTFADYWDLIVLAIVITVIISLLLVVFATRRVK